MYYILFWVNEVPFRCVSKHFKKFSSFCADISLDSCWFKPWDGSFFVSHFFPLSNVFPIQVILMPYQLWLVHKYILSSSVTIIIVVTDTQKYYYINYYYYYCFCSCCCYVIIKHILNCFCLYGLDSRQISSVSRWFLEVRLKLHSKLQLLMIMYPKILNNYYWRRWK